MSKTMTCSSFSLTNLTSSSRSVGAVGSPTAPPVHYLALHFAPTPPPALPEQAGDGPGDRAVDREDPDRDHIGAHPPTTRLNHDRGYGVHQLPNHLLHHGLCTLS